MKTNNRLTWGLYGAIASLTMSLSMAIATLEVSLGLQPVSASPVLASPVLESPEYAIATKQKQDKPKVVRITGNYKTVFTPEFLAAIKKQGVQSVSGQWTIQPNGTFEAFLTATMANSAVRNFRTAGKISIVKGKVISQIETVNGVKPEKAPQAQSYTLLQDGKTLQADGQPIQLVRQ
jgi:hypothetical protein